MDRDFLVIHYISIPVILIGNANHIGIIRVICGNLGILFFHFVRSHFHQGVSKFASFFRFKRRQDFVHYLIL